MASNPSNQEPADTGTGGKRYSEPVRERDGSAGPKFLKVYNLIALLSWPILFCYYLLVRLANGKYRQSYLYRMGIDLPRPPAPSARRIWFHALSVGEVLSAQPLVKAIRDRCPGAEIVFTTATETGQKTARERFGPYVRHFFYLPHDFPWIIDEFVRRVDASLFIQVETDIWVNILRALERLRIPRILVNGRLSPKSAKRYRRYRFLFSPFGLFDHIFAQSRRDRDVFVALGADPEKVDAVGNLKFDSLPERLCQCEIDQLRKMAGIDEDRLVWIAGSTHEGEEEMLFNVHRDLRNKYSDLLLVLAPRNIRRAASIASLAERFGLPLTSRSSGATCRGAAVYLLDLLGELSRFYALADAAFIGGSLVAFGGHNPLEAVVQDKPCVWGPHLFNFPEIETELLQAGVAKRAASEKDLAGIIDGWLEMAKKREKPGRAAENLLASHSGCADRIVNFIVGAEGCSFGGEHPDDAEA